MPNSRFFQFTTFLVFIFFANSAIAEPLENERWIVDEETSSESQESVEAPPPEVAPLSEDEEAEFKEEMARIEKERKKEERLAFQRRMDEFTRRQKIIVDEFMSRFTGRQRSIFSTWRKKYERPKFDGTSRPAPNPLGDDVNRPSIFGPDFKE